MDVKTRVGWMPSWALVLGGVCGGGTVMLVLAAAFDSAALDRRYQDAGSTDFQV